MQPFIVEFDLRTKCPVTVENGDVITDKGHLTVTVRNVQAESHEEAVDKASAKANAFLDELSFQHGIHLELSSGYTVGSQDSPATRHVKKYEIKLSMKGGHREKFPRVLGMVKLKPANSKAYHRKAAISQDSFDKFRNLYLGIENIASRIAFAKGKHIGYELDLLEFALQECFSSNIHRLEDHSYLIPSTCTKSIFQEMATLLFKGYRCQLAHSKAREDKKIPFNPNDEWEVERILPLTELVARSLIQYEDDFLSA
jgi:hypothetical protein